MKSSLFAVVLSVALLGCTTTSAYRTPTATPQVAGNESTSSFSLEQYSYTGEHTSGNYYLGFVEFDDQGWYQDVRQQEVLLNWLQDRHRQVPKQNFLIVAYAHGWKHDARANDPDVRKFKLLLHDLALQEEAAHDRNPGHLPRIVVGVYLGWRGESLEVPVLHNITFWTRKNAAERIGHRSAKDLLLLLNQFRGYANGWCTADRLASPDETQLVLIGHSFGGQLMYNALQTEITDRALRLDSDGNFRTAKSFGDFVLLVNPAFEGAEYESLWQAALMRRYPASQKPILAIVTSDADWGTGWAFPAGRLYTQAQAAPHEGERETVMRAVGHLARYRTHRLSAPPHVKPASAQQERSERAAQVTLENVMSVKSAPTTPGEVVSFDHGILTRLDNPVGFPNFPYLSIYTDNSMMRDHNDIWNDNFRLFMLEFITRQVMDHRTSSRPVGACSGVE